LIRVAVLNDPIIQGKIEKAYLWIGCHHLKKAKESKVVQGVVDKWLLDKYAGAKNDQDLLFELKYHCWLNTDQYDCRKKIYRSLPDHRLVALTVKPRFQQDYFLLSEEQQQFLKQNNYLDKLYGMEGSFYKTSQELEAYERIAKNTDQIIKILKELFPKREDRLDYGKKILKLYFDSEFNYFFVDLQVATSFVYYFSIKRNQDYLNDFFSSFPAFERSAVKFLEALPADRNVLSYMLSLLNTDQLKSVFNKINKRKDLEYCLWDLLINSNSVNSISDQEKARMAITRFEKRFRFSCLKFILAKSSPEFLKIFFKEMDSFYLFDLPIKKTALENTEFFSLETCLKYLDLPEEDEDNIWYETYLEKDKVNLSSNNFYWGLIHCIDSLIELISSHDELFIKVFFKVFSQNERLILFRLMQHEIGHIRDRAKIKNLISENGFEKVPSLKVLCISEHLKNADLIPRVILPKDLQKR
jgi:hypothetical protein